MMPIDDLRALVEGAFPDDEIHLSSPMNDDNHFQLVVVSPRFEGMSMVQQHQMVYQALGDSMKEAVHALAMQTFTPDQWAQSQSR